ncbi:MAG: tRNA preQ1(34) S-adenosylmethionine ribosyltransferase-isomerase QueA [Atribacterota bacterium]|nr:tRNA preQ1(34) S-adenosylmethionine ribosyltransferase-isomerase QueA [Atribacterota bacterium]MDD4896664.1 tRNA preQ1(34) S-adenosylmethionine ribosyltransferase-isomerase QueA [Atribacterota bacterium]MDD5637512.1 tRNA preQ1(34) S-adenosylmethionine ribosyltransferase-isomerase QueA [Atribacterota bacterium]
MDITIFDYNLSNCFIAQEPLVQRDKSRLMVLDRKDEKIKHKNFFQIIDYLKPDDLLVLNDSKVVPARLFGYKKETGGKVEALLLNSLSDYRWQALLKPGRKASPGTEIIFTSQLEAMVISKDEEQGVFVLDMKTEGNFQEILQKIGKVPIPPYIKKELKNPTCYQTVYSRREGSIAAPTAGIHFTKELLTKIKKKGIEIIYLTLHIGRGTFELVKVSHVEQHRMKEELYTITSENAKAINQALLEKRRIVGVGTSVTRALESAFINDRITEGTRWTSLFIYPGYCFKVINALITNFHLPRSTPLMLASAFAGKEFLFKAYQVAMQENYRFYSFGDSMFII